MEASLSFLYPFGLLIFRCGALISVAPVLSSRVIAMRFKLALALCVAFAAYTGAGAPRVLPPTSVGDLAIAAVSETLLGLLGGLGPRLLLEAATAAGQTAGLSMGLGFGALVDPSSGAESTVLGQLFSTLAASFALAFGIHREAIAWLAYGVHKTPPGSAVSLQPLLISAIEQGIASTALAVRVAFPLLAAVTFGHAVLAVLGRSAPQLSLSSLGFSIALFAGGAALYVITPNAAELCARAAVTAFQSR